MTEAKEQEALIQRAQYHPITRDLLYAIPNDGIRTPALGAKFKRRGLRPGLPDVCLPYPSKGYHALYIELKRGDLKSRVSDLQYDWIAKLKKAGNYASLAWGWEDAWEQIENYLT
jgi:hypothetical protein